MSSPNMQPDDRHVDGTAGERRYETRDVRLSAIATLLTAIVLLALLTLPGLAYMLKTFRDRAAGQDPRVSPLIDPRQLPPEPRLQSAPMADYQTYVREQQRQLESYGWIDKATGVVRIPVSRAMEIALERGLPNKSARDTEERQQEQP